jgi:hypothetical protein
LPELPFMAGHLRLVTRNGVQVGEIPSPPGFAADVGPFLTDDAAFDLRAIDGATALDTRPAQTVRVPLLDDVDAADDGDLSDLAEALAEAGARDAKTATAERAFGAMFANSWTTMILAASIIALPSDAASELPTAVAPPIDASLAADDGDSAARPAAPEALPPIAAYVASSDEDAGSSSVGSHEPRRDGDAVTEAPQYDVGSGMFAPVPLPPAHGSSTPPDTLQLTSQTHDGGEAAAGSQVVAPMSSGTVTDAGEIFVVDGSGIAVIIGNGGNDTVDFSAVTATPATAESIVSHGDSGISQDALMIASAAGKGVFVDLSASDVSVATAQGEVTVQAWRLDASGLAAQPLAHIEGVNRVVTSLADDIVVGNENANTFVYAAAPATSETAATAVALSFDIYTGGPLEADTPADDGDTVDFSRIDRATLADANGATGLIIDLGTSVDVNTVDPLDGSACVTTGSLVTTTGGDRADAVALIAWSDDDADQGSGASTIENVIGSQGDDHITGDSHDNILAGGGGGDTFYFVDFEDNDDGSASGRTGHDEITDFTVGGSGVPDGDVLAFSAHLLDSLPAAAKAATVAAFLDAYGHDDNDDSFLFIFDEHSSLRLDHVSRHDFDAFSNTSREIAIVDGHFFYI